MTVGVSRRNQPRDTEVLWNHIGTFTEAEVITDVDDDTVLSEVAGYVNGIRNLPEYCTYVAEILG